MWFRVCEKVTVIALAFRRLPVRSQTRNFMSTDGAADARAGAATSGALDVVNADAAATRATA